MNIKKKREFEKFRDDWKENWYDYYRLLDIDFEQGSRISLADDFDSFVDKSG